MIGQRLGPYEITARLGAGGMGEVYRAHDDRLERDVALKLLPPALANDAERIARFQREAKTLAQLNHSNIAALLGIEHHEGRQILVMELVEGQDLSERIAAGPLPLDEALDVARQLAEALEEAHENGIIHRDLKPSNVKLRPDGRVKLLDFGLARALEGASVTEGDIAESPTITAAMTQPGVVLGTAGYMSPEQARGRQVDRRADLWSFGVILWEMLAGKRLFAEETVSDTLAAVLRAEVDWEGLPAGTPPAVRELLARCLDRDPRQRLRDIGEARVRLEEWKRDPHSMDRSLSAPMPALRASRIPTWLPWSLTVLSLIALAWFARPRATEQTTPQIPALDIPYAVETGSADYLSERIISRDGRKMAYSVGSELRVRDLETWQERTLLQSAFRVSCMRFSPDGDWIALVYDGALRRIPSDGGPALEIAAAAEARGIDWIDAQTLVFTPDFLGGLIRVRLEDGSLTPLTELDSAKDERSHRWPTVLPDGNIAFLCNYVSKRYEDSDIQVLDPRTGERKTVYRGGSFPRYASSGHLLFARHQTLMAIRYSLDAHEPIGTPSPLVQNLLTSVQEPNTNSGNASFDLSANGVLIYDTVTGAGLDDARSTPAVVDLSTGDVHGIGTPSVFNIPTLSPNGEYISVIQGVPGGAEVFTARSDASILRQLSFSGGLATSSVWSRDGRAVYWAAREDSTTIYRSQADGATRRQKLFQIEALSEVFDVNTAGTKLLLSVWRLAELFNVEEFDLESGTLRTIAGGDGLQLGSRYSPDDRWIAYVSLSAAGTSLFVRSAEDPDLLWKFGREFAGAIGMGWVEDGSAILIGDASEVSRVPVDYPNGYPEFGDPSVIHSFTVPVLNAGGAVTFARSGERAVLLVAEGEGGVEIRSHLVPNYFTLLGELR